MGTPGAVVRCEERRDEPRNPVRRAGNSPKWFRGPVDNPGFRASGVGGECLDCCYDHHRNPDVRAAPLPCSLGCAATRREIARAEVEKAQLVIEWAVLNEADPAACVGFFADKALPVAGVGLRWSRSSRCWSTPPPSASAPRPGSRRSVGWWSCATGSRACGLGCWRGGCRCGGPAGSPNRPVALPAAGAAHVDQHLAPVAHSCSWAQVDRLVEAGDGPVRPRSRRGQAARGGGEAPR